MGRGRSVQWEHRRAELDDGRVITWTFRPDGPYPQIVTARVDDEQIADRIEPDGHRIHHTDVAAELLRSIGHPDGSAHAPLRDERHGSPAARRP